MLCGTQDLVKVMKEFKDVDLIINCINNFYDVKVW